MREIEAFCSQLRREPDFDAPELQAYDAADLLLLDAFRQFRSPEQTLVTIGDRHGALTLGTAEVFGARGIRVHQDALLSERALAANAARLGLQGMYENHELGEMLLRGATYVLVQLPRSLAELEEIAWHIARWASPDVTVLAGGRDKHMSRGMNEVLGRYFGEVTASRGWRKARVLTARGPRAGLGEPPFAVWGGDPDLGFRLAAYGATFGGAKLDHGSRLLLGTLREQPPAGPQHVVDLGCGNGVLAVSAALAWPEATVIASDQSAAAVKATKLTAEGAGVAGRVEVHRADASEAVPDGWADLVLLNPPFHAGSTVHAGVAHRLIRSCARILAPGAELRLVFNSHLKYRALVEREIGPVRQLARDSTFTVLAVNNR